ncbi:MAG: hypothetical protein FWC70_03675 [Defluviitaleaceae bacterium]|nr:hypothetical protein [Defluviitaleaceae bacterium]
MSIVNLSGLTVTEGSYRRARQIVDERSQENRKTGSEVLASLREMMPGWTITTCASQWGNGARNLEISERTLERMAQDPEAMVRYKALVLDLEDAVPALEEWKRENPGQYFEFGLMFDNENIRGSGLVRTLLGGETRETFDLPENEMSLWADLIRQKLDSLSQTNADNAADTSNTTRSWMEYLS